MNIIHITPDYNFAINFVKPVCEEQLKLGHDVSIITTHAFYNTDGRLGEDLLKTNKKGEKLEVLFLNLRLRKFQVSLLTSYGKFIKMLFKRKIDVVIFHTSLDTTFPILLTSLFSKAKRIYFNHGVAFLGYNGLLKLALKLIEKMNILLAHRTFTVSQAMVSALHEISAEKIECILPGSACGIKIIESEYSQILLRRSNARKKLHFGVDKKVVIFVGRPVKRKGLFDVLRAWEANNYDESYLLLLAGPSAEDFNVRSLPNNVIPLGYIDDMDDYYLSSDVLCVPSYHDGLGYVYIEAAAAGCVPICSDIPGPTDFVIHEKTGMIVKPGNIEDIAKAFDLAFSDKKKLENLSISSFKKALNYDKNIVASRIAKELLK